MTLPAWTFWKIYPTMVINGHFWIFFPKIPIFKTVKSKLHELSSKGHLNTLAPPCGQNSRNCESDDTVKG